MLSVECTFLLMCSITFGYFAKSANSSCYQCYCCFSNDLVTIPIFQLLKQSRSNNYKCILNLKYFCQSPATCTVLPLQHYVDWTKSISGRISQLFISFRKPYTPVSQSTTRRWITTPLREAGIDTSVFKSHSTRAGAASSARDNSMPVDYSPIWRLD